MSDELLPFYNRELAFFRAMGAEFAEAHPKIASRLRLGPDGSQDPHVERMVQAFAYLNARIRHKLDDDFPEITDALLGVLYPHYLAPTPSMAIVQFALDRSQGELTGGYSIEPGKALATEPVDGEACQFRTCYPVTVWPLVLERASLSGPPFSAPSAPRATAAVLRLELSTLSANVAFADLKLDTLRFFLHSTQAQDVYTLYELIFNNTIQLGLASSPRDSAAVLLPRSALRSVGFARDEGLIPYSARSLLGYRLLTELFALPQKFLFFEIAGLTSQRLAGIGNKLELYLYLNRSSTDLERQVSKDTFRLGCTPIVNLYRQRADPFLLTQTETEYRVVPDARRPKANEIFSIDRVAATSPEGEQVEYAPFYSFKHAQSRQQQQTFWYATRRPSGAEGERNDERPREPPTEVYLSFVDLGFSASAPADWTIDIETTCLNRDLPSRLPFGGGRPYLELPEGKGPLADMVCLTAPTPSLRPPHKHGALWRLISHLSLNHLSIAGGDEGAHALREILRLYNVSDSESAHAMIDGIARVGSRRVVGRATGLAGGFCRGIEVEIEFDEQRFSGSGAFFFACVLERFLGLYCSINSFSKLVASSQQRRGRTEPWKWPPRAGERVLL